jgi:hypothetical protein
MDEHIHFEVFIAKHISTIQRQIEHQCLEVDDLGAFIEKCRSMEVEVALIPKGDKTLIFIKDFDGNLFEITQQNRV